MKTLLPGSGVMRRRLVALTVVGLTAWCMAMVRDAAGDAHGDSPSQRQGKEKHVPPEKLAGLGMGNLPPSGPPGMDETLMRVKDLAAMDGVNTNYIWFEHISSEVVAYLAPSDAAAVAAFEWNAQQFTVGKEPFTVKIVHVARTNAESSAMQDLIIPEHPYWEQRGIKIGAVGIRVSGDIVDVTAMKRVPDNALAQLRSRYGTWIELRTGTRGPRPATQDGE